MALTNDDIIEAPYTITGVEAPAQPQPQQPTHDDKESNEPATAPTPAPAEQTEEQEKEKADEGKAAEKQADEPKPEEASRNDADSKLNEKGLNLAEFEEEFTANGVLSETSLAKLEQSGIPRAMVDAYIQGQQALVNSFVEDVKALAGGEEGYNDTVAWAKENFSDAERAAYDKVMFSGDKDLIKIAVAGLVAKFRDAEGHEPALTQGKASATRSVNTSGYTNMSEMQAAMRDPRYRKDPDYTHEVEQRTMRATFM